MTRWMRKLGLVAAGCLLFGSVQAQEPTVQQVRELMQIMHLQRNMQNLMGLMTRNLSRALSAKMVCVPPHYWDQLFGEKTEAQIIDQVVPVYQKNFTQSEVAQLIAFYKTPLGQHIVKIMPKVQRESAFIGERVGRERAQALFGALVRKGVIDAQGKCLSGQAAKP